MVDDIMASGAVHSDVGGEHLNPKLKMVLALMNLINKPDQYPFDPDARVAEEESLHGRVMVLSSL